MQRLPRYPTGYNHCVPRYVEHRKSLTVQGYMILSTQPTATLESDRQVGVIGKLVLLRAGDEPPARRNLSNDDDELTWSGWFVT